MGFRGYITFTNWRMEIIKDLYLIQPGKFVFLTIGNKYLYDNDEIYIWDKRIGRYKLVKNLKKLKITH